MKKYNYQGIFDLIESCDSGMTCINNEHLDNVLAPYQYYQNGEIKYRPMSEETFSTISDILSNGSDDYAELTCQSCDGALEWSLRGKDVSNLESNFFYTWYGEDSNSIEWEEMLPIYQNLPDLVPVFNIKTLNYPNR